MNLLFGPPDEHCIRNRCKMKEEDEWGKKGRGGGSRRRRGER